MACDIWERYQVDKAAVVCLIGIVVYAVVTYALLPTILAEHAPPIATAMATITLIEDLIHSPRSTTIDALAQATPTFLLLTFYVGIMVTWWEVIKFGNSIVRRLDAN